MGLHLILVTQQGDGHKKNAQGCCKEVAIKLGEYAMVGEFFLFDLGVDLI